MQVKEQLLLEKIVAMLDATQTSFSSSTSKKPYWNQNNGHMMRVVI